MIAWARRTFIAAIGIKALLFVGGQLLPAPAALESLDRVVNFVLLAAAATWLYRITRMARTGALWSVSRKLLVSYMLIGAVPILLLVTFSLLAFLLVSFDVSSYLVQNRFNDLIEQASTFARTTLYEIERAPRSGHADIVSRRQAAIRTKHPGATVSVVQTTGHPPCGLSPSLESKSIPEMLPRWVDCRGFGGMLDGRPIIARAVALPSPEASFAVMVDVPVDASLSSALEGTGIQLGQERQPKSLFNTATYLSLTDWDTGMTRQSAVPMSVNVGTLYRWLGASQGARANFNEVLLFVLAGIGVLLLIIEMVALGNGLALARSITAAVDDLFHGTERVKAGEFRHAIAVRSADQLGELAASFNDMIGRIGQLVAEQTEKRRLEEELRIARGIQMSLLPHGPLSIPGLSVGALCAPAREVGGDYYDLLPLDAGRTGVLIADVAGKGTSAALYMAELKGLMLSLSRIHTSPRELLIEANRIISRHLQSGSFITMIYAVFDVGQRTMTCARAGHAPFIRIPAGPADARRARVLAPDGMVLGLNLDNGERFERILKEVTIPLADGDLFFFFTDGISEAMDRQGTCFGEPRLSAFLEANAERSVEEIRDLVLQEVETFVDGQPQHDDITMVILRADFNEGTHWTT